MRNARPFILALAALVSTAAVAQETQPPAAKLPQPAGPAQPAVEAYARLSFLSGQAFLQRAADLGFENAAANMPVAVGDRLATTSGRAEVRLAQGAFVRLDENTKLDFLALPKTGDPLVRLRSFAGSIYLDLGRLEKEKSVEILTSDATFYILDEGLYRVDVRDNGRTDLLVFEGLVEASGEEGSTLVKKNQKLTASNGRFDGRPGSFFAAADDAFDRWNKDRDSVVRRPYANRRLPETLEDFEGELEESGDWRESEEFGWVWVPRGLDPDWRPYSLGRWLWMPSGWCWLPYETWGWATFHYGYWHWGLGLGWHWIPHHVWGQAWVSWWWDPWYYGWAPMSWWGHPGIVLNNRYYGRGWNGDYPSNSRALTVVRKDQLQAPNIRKAALSGEALKSVGRMDLKSTSLAARPEARPGVKIENLEGDRRVILRKDGQGTPPAGSGDRRIRRVDGRSGYPSSSQVSRSRILQGTGARSLRPPSNPGRTLRSSPPRASASRTTGRSFSAPSRSSSRGASSGGSSRSSGPSRSGGSAGRSSGPGGGSIRKK